MTDLKWSYLDAAREKQGPLSRDDLYRLASDGTVNDDTLVWRPGMSGWLKFGEVDELRQDGPGQRPAGNLLTQRLNGSPSGSADAGKTRRSVPGGVKFGAILAAIAAVIWLNRVFMFLPGSGRIVDSDIPDRWFSEDNREGVIMQCTFDRKAGRGPNGGPRFRVSALVSAGVARNRVLPVDRQGSSRVIVRDSEGNEVFNQLVSNAKLCPS